MKKKINYILIQFNLKKKIKSDNLKFFVNIQKKNEKK